MHNTNKPRAEDLPSAQQLLRSTIIAALSAGILLTTDFPPAEYAIDATGIGKILGITEMGEIKNDLRDEAQSDDRQAASQSPLLTDTFAIFVAPAAAQDAAPDWQDSFSFTLQPGEGIEWKPSMEQGAIAHYSWSTDGGRVNYDLHGDGSGQSISYAKGRGKREDTGAIAAAFAGSHGWFWWNRDAKALTVTVQLRGAYSDLKQT